MPKISIIVPVYKAEAYLRRCVDSLLAQTFKDFEILLVDDGSPDRSGEICDEYARKDSRVRVFHKENGGVSSARQCGLDNACGEYTIHADPDDWVEPDMLEALYQKAKSEDADMVICDFYIEQNERQIYSKQQPSALDHETVLRELFQQLHGSCWNKLVRRACYTQLDVHFPNGINLWEDQFVNFCLLMNDIKISYLNKAYYHYDLYSNSSSIVRTQCKRNVQEQMKFISYFEPRLRKLGNFEDEIIKLKISTVERAFVSHEYQKKEFATLYPELRPQDFFQERGIFPKLVGLSLCTNYKLMQCCATLYKHFSNIRQYLKRLKK